MRRETLSIASLAAGLGTKRRFIRRKLVDPSRHCCPWIVAWNVGGNVEDAAACGCGRSERNTSACFTVVISVIPEVVLVRRRHATRSVAVKANRPASIFAADRCGGYRRAHLKTSDARHPRAHTRQFSRLPRSVPRTSREQRIHAICGAEEAEHHRSPDP